MTYRAHVPGAVHRRSPGLRSSAASKRVRLHTACTQLHGPLAIADVACPPKLRCSPSCSEPTTSRGSFGPHPARSTEVCNNFSIIVNVIDQGTKSRCPNKLLPPTMMQGVSTLAAQATAAARHVIPRAADVSTFDSTIATTLVVSKASAVQSASC